MLYDYSMKKTSLLFYGLLFLILCVSGTLIALNASKEDSGTTESSTSAINSINDAPIFEPNPWKTTDQKKTLTAELTLFKNKLERLEERILELEQSEQLEAAEADNESEQLTSPTSPQHNKALSTDLLIEAGISDSRAAEIIRHRNSIELKKLELNDKATREGYKGSARYRRELSELTKALKPLRSELGDEAFDYYLYASGQTNRVEVLSVMQNSAAEQTGLQPGDYIHSYDQIRMFNWIELKRATAEGELGEYVSIDIIRDGQQFNLWVPRGPLGVMLGTASEAP